MERLLTMQNLPRAAPKRAAAGFRAAAAPFVCQSCQRSHRRFTSTAAPPPPPSSGYAHLTSRRLVSIAGADASKFLQGIITQSIFGPGTSGPPTNHDRNTSPPPAAAAAANVGFYSGFLNATGRVLHDVFIYRDTLGLGGAAGDGEGEAFVIEIDEAQLGRLLKQIKRYMLRSKLRVRALEEGEGAAWQVWWDSDESIAQTSPSSSSDVPLPTALLDQFNQRKGDLIMLPDTRAPGLGYRVLSKGAGAGADGLSLDLDLERSTDEAYRVRRYLRGVPEGQSEILCEQALPLEANMDLMGGIDFRKGCYVGQELTIRTKHRGVVRKRILPCAVYGEDGPPPSRLEYRPGDDDASVPAAAQDIPCNLSIGRDGKAGRSAGNWLRGVGNIGLALCRLQIMTDVELPGETAAAPFDPSNEFVMRWGADEEGNGGRTAKVKAFVPDWLRARLSESHASGH
ncbi:Aminomethyltransferase folate-binding domain-containing protein [Xylariaceae sp. FL0662B]|nr:Aminomethyltransferase folate-binding domain-containing protein [Xylariaceae sp. FL0662B]